MMKTGKVVVSKEIPIEVWKCLGDVGVCWLTNNFNNILSSNKMPYKWRRNTLRPIYEKKKKKEIFKTVQIIVEFNL